MKQFFENYGAVALGILALLVLIAMITPVGNLVKTSLQGTVQTFSTSINSQTDDMDKQLQEAFNNAVADLTHVDTPYVKGDFSAKGNLVEINGTQFRVLSVYGMQAKVVSMENYESINYNTTDSTTSFGDITGVNYNNSLLDIKMNEFYNSLPSEIQNAIVEQNIKQSIYFYTSDVNTTNPTFTSWYKPSFLETDPFGNTFYLLKKGEINIGNKKVFSLDVDDLISYLGSNTTAKDVVEMFWGSRSNVGDSYLWTRSAYANAQNGAIYISGKSGDVFGTGFTNIRESRPAFVIDLSLLQ